MLPQLSFTLPAIIHLEGKDCYVRLLFQDFDIFNTIIPQALVNKMQLLGVKPSLCNWVLDILTNRPQSARVHGITSSTTVQNIGSPQGCLLSPLLYTLLTYDSSERYPGNQVVKFADDTAGADDNNESKYRQEVKELVTWCTINNLCINVRRRLWNLGRGISPHLQSSSWEKREAVEKYPPLNT